MLFLVETRNPTGTGRALLSACCYHLEEWQCVVAISRAQESLQAYPLGLIHETNVEAAAQIPWTQQAPQEIQGHDQSVNVKGRRLRSQHFGKRPLD